MNTAKNINEILHHLATTLIGANIAGLKRLSPPPKKKKHVEPPKIGKSSTCKTTYFGFSPQVFGPSFADGDNLR